MTRVRPMADGGIDLADRAALAERPAGSLHRPVPRVHQRRTTRPASRLYSRFVTVMKFLLPAAALAMLALLAAWPSLNELGSPHIVADKGQLEMIGPRYFSIDENNQPYSLTAARADQSNEYPGLVALDQPEAEMTETEGTWVTLRSDRGWYDRNTGLLRMNGNVRVMRDDGTEFTTDEAFSDVDKSTAWGDRHVVGQGPQGEIDATGFRMTERGRNITFLNNSKASVAAAPAPTAAPVQNAAPSTEPAPAATAPAAPAPSGQPPAAVKPPVRPGQAAGRVVIDTTPAPRAVPLVKPPPVKPPVPPAAKGAKP